MLLAAGQREQDVEHSRSQRDEGLISFHVRKYMSVTDIYQVCVTEQLTKLQNKRDAAARAAGGDENGAKPTASFGGGPACPEVVKAAVPKSPKNKLTRCVQQW